MPAPAPLSPGELLERFLDQGYSVIDEDEWNWLVAAGEQDEPFVIPKHGEELGIEVMKKANGRLGQRLLKHG